MSGLSGALVCAVSRGTAFGQAASVANIWDQQRQELQAAYDQFIVPQSDPPETIVDLQVVILALAPGGDDWTPGLHTPFSLPWVNPLPSFVRGTVEDIFVESSSTPGQTRDPTPRRGWVPETKTYTDLFDDRQAAGETSRAYVPHFGHPPKDFLISANTRIENHFVFRRRRRVAGLEALGISNGTVKPATRNLSGHPAIDDWHGYRDDMLITAIRAIRDHFGTATEVSEFSSSGYVVGTPPAPEETFDTIYGTLARMLNRAFKLT